MESQLQVAGKCGSRRRWSSVWAVGALALLSVPSIGAASLITMTSDPADGEVGTDAQGTYLTVSPLIRLGGVSQNGGARYRSAILLFQLPANVTGPITVNSASFSFEEAGTPSGGITPMDLWGLGYQSGTTLSPTWHCGADTDANPLVGWQGGVANPGRTKIQDNILTSANPKLIVYSTSSAANETLRTFLQTVYDNGAQAGQYVILRLNVDSLPGSRTYSIYSGDEGSTYKPTLVMDITTAPEPAASALMLGGLAGVLLRRSGRKTAVASAE